MMTIAFKGSHFERDVILWGVRAVVQIYGLVERASVRASVFQADSTADCGSPKP
jgi:hypothetical protein